jgi:Uma2 family endonuclease
VSDRAMRLMTVEEFLAWQTEQDQLYELVDGLPLAMAGAKLRHDRVTANAIRNIGNQLRAANSPCDAFTDDVGVLTPVRRVRRPDVSVLCPPFDEDATVTDRPRLVVEVLSESTEHVDRLFKLGEYQSMASIDYIVMIDPTRVEVGFWSRDAAGAWQSQWLREPDSMIEMPKLGPSISLAALYERVPLDPATRPRLVWGDENDGTPSPGTAA